MIGVGLGLLSAGLSAYGNYKQGQRNIKLSQTTPSEREYIKRQQQIAEQGDPNLQSKFNRVIGGLRQQGQFAQQRATGNIIGQGLENSIIASDIRRRTDQTTMRSIAEQSQMLAEQNRLAKQQASDRALQMQMGVQGRVRQAQMNAPSTGDMLRSIAGAGIGSFMQHQYAPVQELDMYQRKRDIDADYQFTEDV
jgi:hypothetical protein